MQSLLRAAFVVAALGSLSACVTEERAEYTQNMALYGTNPYIEAPHVKDLERRIDKIVMANRMIGPEYQTRFDPRNKAILDNFKDLYDHNELVADMALTRVDFETAVTSLYPVIGSDKGCEITDKEGYFFNQDDEPTRFDWQFVNGSCQNGLAHGVGRLRAAQSDAIFVGEFDQGVMTSGIFTMKRKDGRRTTQIGGIPGENHNARILTTQTRPDGYQWHLYGDFNDRGQFDGFGMNVWGYVNLLHVHQVGQYKADKLEGFGAKQLERDYADGSIWHVWIGFYHDGSLNGWGAWSNTANGTTIGQWKDGTLNGVGYTTDMDVANSMHEFYAGPYVDGERHGSFRKTTHGIFGENEGVVTYDRGVWVDAVGSDFDFGKVIALTAGAVAIGSADIDATSMAEIGGAFASDILGETGGSNMRNLQSAYNSRLSNLSLPASNNVGGTGSSTGTSTVAGEKLKEFDTTITCPDTGVTSDITIPYRTEACRVAALDFAKTFSCNKTDQDRVVQNCQSACGHPQCLEQ
ncbi:hypothetical protein TH19_16660 [Thalassospira profundimaris]|uniref:Uncharacterized protein n=1 Tax=Thalassospira profundimaris TaxID=502049 RepID=A0A367W217_9PROT|nr:hypothetical protein [Thalassospira profundimaris]RCK33839.1 hypothetical protein TH19_16660 [Thalassospira profundimaris]